ncbi:hypothetical protein BCV70DRAFT_145927, partial [Testicularia cyperi]
SPVIPGRRVYNIDDDFIASSQAASSSAAVSSSTGSFSTITPSDSASQVAPHSPRRPTRKLSTGGVLDDAKRQTSRSPRKQNLTNLEMASLSTPELHLASDPMLDTQEPSFLRKLVHNPKVPSIDTLSSAGGEGPNTLHGHDRTRSIDPIAAVKPTLGYASFGTAMDAVEQTEGTAMRRVAPSDHQRSRKQSSATIRESGGDSPGASVASGSGPWQSANASTDTLSPSRAEGSGRAPRKSPVNTAISSAGTWFKRQRKVSARARDEDMDSNVANAAEDVNNTTDDSKTSLSTTRSQTSLATAGTGSTSFSDSNSTMLSSAVTDTTFGMQDLASPQAALDSIRRARSFMIRELSNLSEQDQGVDQIRISQLVSQITAESQDADTEASQFWSSIADGVLLCVLANRLKPGCVDRIDRRDVQWVRNDNISRFLRAARDHLGLRSKDLFQTFDLTDCTVEGLLRVVHTLAAAEKMAKRSSRMAALRTNGFRIEPRTTSMTPPTTPRAHERHEMGSEDSERPCSPLAATADRSNDDETPRRNMLRIQQNRREAERILVSMGRSDSGRVDAATAALRRQSNDSYPPKHKSSSITFADSVKSSSDDESRLPYRDRKLSESAISLTGVAEEDPEDLTGSNDQTQLPSQYSFNSTVSSCETPQIRRGSSESEKSNRGSSTRPPPLARSSSQKRISQELALGLLPRSVIGSTENLDDYLSASSNSPSRHPPTRRHSARLYPGPSLLNPSRESLITLGAQSGTESEASPSARVPFPRGALANDSPGARRIGRHLSMNAGSMDSFSAVSHPSTANASSSPKMGTRPQFRHMRYSSDLHLPSMHRPISHGGRSPEPSGDERSFVSASRTRFDSEMGGSIYTNTLGSLTNDELSSAAAAGVAKTGRDTPAPKHKLVVTEEGKPNVTYQLGNCIGRGQFGSVYRALNLNSGQMVAVKRIKLDGRSDDEVTELMNEVDLLKSLTHPSVVKYEGLVRGTDVVSIILEYVENGSLLHTLKAFGTFPEKLVASYVVKILEGLNYLHEQNVVHCDLKAANILTTKNGNVKLSDFGVSLNLKAVKKMGGKNDAIGTPNWMAPEVIELKGVTTAADIWSLGCTIIELLTGKPPYYDMLAMSAMFRIVEDDCPPLPEKCSELLRDLLLQCFNKDPTKRPSAEMLFEHEWVRQVWSGHKELRPQDSVPFLRRISADIRRLDPRMFDRDDSIAHQPIMERTTSSPPPTVQRPALDPLRSHTSPAESSAGTVTERSPAVSPHSTPPVQKLTLPDASDFAGPHVGQAALVPPTPISPTTISPMQEASMLDLSAFAGDEAKPHAFVKSTFSKAVACKICREPVKKHAVLCEECGLVCHARCAVHAPAPCNLRAQLLLFQQRASIDQTSSTSHGANLSPLLGGAAPTAAAVGPTNFKFPFGMKRPAKVSGVDASTSPESDTVSPPSPPTTAAASAKPAKEVARRRRISLIPGRQRSPSPPPAPEPVDLGLSSSSSQSILHGVRRHSSMSYGSISGSSSISSAAGHIMAKTSSGGSSSQPYKQLGIQHVTSTPSLAPNHVVYGEQVTSDRYRRRLSTGCGGAGQPDHSMTQQSTRRLDRAGLATGQATPKAPTIIERKKSRRVSSKTDCTIM